VHAKLIDNPRPQKVDKGLTLIGLAVAAGAKANREQEQRGD